jgi:hypothetical protein
MKTLDKAHSEGCEVFAKHCLRYGNIVQDESFTGDNGNHERNYVIELQGCYAEITKLNGEVVRYSYYPQ